MKTIISQKLLNVLKNKIIPIISLKLFNDVEFLLNNLFVNDGSNHYFSHIYKIQTSAREMVKSIVSSTFEELDNDFKESTYRKTRYFVNKSNVSRTLITIVGEITFKRTYYVSQNNSVKFYLCEFHFKQSINHITTDANERYYLIHIFKNKPKSYFIDAVGTIIYNNPNRKETITKKLNYIINNYANIKSMLDLNIDSSMESHISHLIASLFSSRPKGFSTKRITKYLKLNDYKNNNINIFKLYLSTYSKKKTTELYENTYDYEIFTPDKIHNIPVLNYGRNTGTYIYLDNISHEISTETYT